jgi:hypothetical protein
MTRVNETGEQRPAAHELLRQSWFGVGLSAARMLLRNPAALRTLRAMGRDEKRYIRPPRGYDIPPFNKRMKHSTSTKPYLRPTRWCNPREPEVIAVANELGAYELSDYEFAKAAYWFVKTNLLVEMLPLDTVRTTLMRGTGTCYHLISVWIALCRAAGIKARYKVFRMMLPDEIMWEEMNEGEAMTANMVNVGIPEGEGEVCIDGTWIVGHVAMPPEIYARVGLPILEFGEDAIGSTFKLIPGTIERFESIPLRYGIAMQALMWAAPAAMERANIAIADNLPQGRTIIDDAGGMRRYSEMAKRRREIFSAGEILDTQSLKHYDNIIIGDTERSENVRRTNTSLR